MSIMRKLAGEPLLQFLIIGLVLFAADRMTAEEAADPREIVVDDAVYARLAGIFQDIEDRPPGPDDMDRMVDRYVINETLFREARALELDHGDDMMRERLVQRMRLLIYSGIEVDAPADDVLKAWLAENPSRYQVPSRLSFRVLGLDATEDEAQREATLAQAREDAGEPVKTEGVRMLSFIGRPRVQLVATFEDSFVSAIEAAPVGKWTAVPSSRGWQVVKLLEALPARAPDFDQIRTRAMADWQEAETQRRARSALDSLMASYPVTRQPFDAAEIEAILANRKPQGTTQ